MNLKEKLLNIENLIFDNKELEYMLVNIGNPDPKIRHETIYILFSEGLRHNSFSREQVEYIIQFVLTNNLIVKEIGTDKSESEIVRSFSALLLALIIENENKVDTKYKNVFTEKQLDLIFNDVIIALENEVLASGYLAPYGWIHSIAHYAELLLRITNTSRYQSTDNVKVLVAIFKCLVNRKAVFTDSEEKRLALILVALYKRDYLSVEELLEWLHQFKIYFEFFPGKSVEELRSKENIVNMFNYLLLSVEDSELREAIKEFNTF